MEALCLYDDQVSKQHRTCKRIRLRLVCCANRAQSKKAFIICYRYPRSQQEPQVCTSLERCTRPWAGQPMLVSSLRAPCGLTHSYGPRTRSCAPWVSEAQHYRQQHPQRICCSTL